jgi:hypothetical protein
MRRWSRPGRIASDVRDIDRTTAPVDGVETDQCRFLSAF